MKTRNMKQILIFRFFSYLILMQELLFGAADIESIVKKIVEFTQSPAVKSICTLIIIGIGIYMAKNHDRLKEIFTMCITIIIALSMILAADKIANWMFS